MSSRKTLQEEPSWWKWPPMMLPWGAFAAAAAVVAVVVAVVLWWSHHHHHLAPGPTAPAGAPALPEDVVTFSPETGEVHIVAPGTFTLRGGTMTEEHVEYEPPSIVLTNQSVTIDPGTGRTIDEYASMNSVDPAAVVTVAMTKPRMLKGVDADLVVVDKRMDDVFATGSVQQTVYLMDNGPEPATPSVTYEDGHRITIHHAGASAYLLVRNYNPDGGPAFGPGYFPTMQIPAGRSVTLTYLAADSQANTPARWLVDSGADPIPNPGGAN